jgi:flagellar assembly protein FliH
MEPQEEPGKVAVKAILKGNAAQAVRPASMSGFKVADFQLNPSAKESAEDYLKNEVASLQSRVANLNGEMENSKKKADQDAKTAHDKGFQEGKAAGIAEGEKKALAKWEENLKKFQEETAQIFEILAAQQSEYFENLRKASTEVAIAVAKRVFCEEAAQNPNIIARAMQEAFTYLGQEEKVRVRLNSMDISSAEQAETFWKPIAGSLKDVELVIDNSMEAGGCLLESEKGSSVDMRVQTILGHIEEAVKKLYNSSESAEEQATEEQVAEEQAVGES